MENAQSGRRRRAQERKCHVCARVFHKAEHLERHVRSHTKERPFECSVCNKTYARHDVLLRHARSHKQASEDGRSQAASAAADSAMSERDGEVSCTGQMHSSIASTASSLEAQLARDLAVASQFPTPEMSLHVPDNPGTNGAEGYQLPLPGTEDLYYLTEDMGDALRRPSTDMWAMTPAQQHASWLAGDDFDINALNAFIATSINPLMDPLPYHVDQLSQVLGNGLAEGDVAVKPLPGTAERWFTYIAQCESLAATGNNTPRLSSDSCPVDELYRDSLQTKLRQRPYDNSLPSTGYLNLTIRFYFTRFSAIFPIVHPATFRAAAESALLLISICSIGSLFIGSPDASAQGVKIFEALNKSVLASWERHISRSDTEVLSVIQACLIGQTFGMLSAEPKHLLLVESFHGSIIAWARQQKALKTYPSTSLQDRLQRHDGNVDLAWREWAQCEARNRVALSLHIHDAELATIFHHEPYLRHEADRIPTPCSDRAWAASSPAQWKEALRKDEEADARVQTSADHDQASINNLSAATNMPNRYHGYILLQGISARISDRRKHGPMDDADIDILTNNLISWYKAYAKAATDRIQDDFCSMVLWHYQFCRLHTDFDLIERAVGRDGVDDAQLCRDEVSSWASSIGAKRSILHASLLYAHVESLPIASQANAELDRLDETNAVVNMPEFALLSLKPSQVPLATKSSEPGKAAASRSSAICGLTDTLQRLGHSGIARKFASILAPLIYLDVSNG